MRHFVSAIAGVTALTWVGFAGTAFGQSSQPVVVVELYTSQGCSSCPPADAFLSELVDQAQVIPLALHVDYWDYIGWKDVFADPAYTVRQKAYARAKGSRMVYTPQMIVGGQDFVEGNRPAEVNALIRQHLAASNAVDLAVERAGGKVRISADALPGLDDPLRVQVVRYKPQAAVEILRGENAGHTITYHNIVTSWDTLGEWNGQEALALDVPVTGKEPVVVILQAKGPAAIVAAAQVK